ncbi:MAG: cation:proton antiporter [Candidatus Kariarchaeaceae archaeon]|jgi:Kef-type K+ transport system membrane component KefB
MVVEFLLPVSEIVFLLGAALFFGYSFSLFFERFGIPNVLVYIIVGFLAGIVLREVEPGFLESESYEYWFKFVENIALGLIGFKIGTEMEFKMLREHSRVIVIVTLMQVIVTFLLVFAGTYVFTQNLLLSLIFGGLATATAPAATIEIIRRFKAKGPLTQRIQWVLAFDDVLAVLVVEAIISYAAISLIGDTVTVGGYLVSVSREIFLAIILGIVVGYVLDVMIEKMKRKLEMMEVTLGALIFTIGLAMTLHTSVILACMTVGALTVNREGNNYEQASDYLEIIMSPVLIIFFSLVGAKLYLDDFNPFPWIAVIYTVTRVIGKIYGTNYGAKLADASPVVQKNLGMSMLPQGGVALGLMAVASDLMIEAGLTDIANLLITTIVISTVFSEAFGSYFSLRALKSAGEVGMADDMDL